MLDTLFRGRTVFHIEFVTVFHYYIISFGFNWPNAVLFFRSSFQLILFGAHLIWWQMQPFGNAPVSLIVLFFRPFWGEGYDTAMEKGLKKSTRKT